MSNSIQKSNICTRNDFKNRFKMEPRWISNILSLTSTILSALFVLFIIMTKVNAIGDTGICQSKDLRNHPSELMSLRNCRVIEGFLMITLIDDTYKDTAYDNLTFPDLVEITEFLMLYRVQGLTSLGHLFPNLRVIRGNHLVSQYALIIYENLHLREIGLKSLTSITRGSVRIERNPLLCFVDTINWLYIANGTETEDHFLYSNKNIYECPICRTGNFTDAYGRKCPASKDASKRYCWNRDNCQKICPDTCGQRSCDNEGKCCDEKCLGSCESSDKSKCAVCRNLSVGPLNNRQCVDECPTNLYEFEQRRCISNIECWNISRPLTTRGNNVLKNEFIPFNGTCSLTCPKYYSPEGPNGGRYCKSCNGECKRECHGSTIDSISAAQNYRGCARITGTLVIQIRQGGHNVIEELEKALSDIEEIDGALKIMRSDPLISLKFFKNLAVIHGMNIQDNYALYVMDNQNLQSLFDQTVIIERGKVFFHFNSKLSYATIEKLKTYVHDLKDVDKFAVEDVARYSNGDKISNVTKLYARPSSIMKSGAIIDVKAMKYDNYGVLLGYVLYYKPSPYQNVSLFNSRDACGNDGWLVQDATNFDRKAPILQIVVTNLKPFTQYAYYVKTYTIESAPYGGQTDILYFRTLPGQPGFVQNLKTESNGSSSIIVTWQPPKVAYGLLTNYIVKASLIDDAPELINQRNYCAEPLSKVENDLLTKPNVLMSSQNSTQSEYSETDDFDGQAPFPPATDINFRNEINNMIYVKRRTMVNGEEPRDRRRRDIQIQNQLDQDIFPTLEKEKSHNDFTESKLISANGKEYYEEFYDDKINASTHSLTLNNLRHFSLYSISVQACRDFGDPNFNAEEFCGIAAMITQRTEKIDNADDIAEVTFGKVSHLRNSMRDSMSIKWREPKDPNGLIVSYTIIYKQVDSQNEKPIGEQCITSHFYANLNGEIPLLQLSKGNYSISVRAASLAGDGNPTPPIFISRSSCFDMKEVQIVQIISAALIMTLNLYYL